MRQCPRCASEINKQDKVCPRCGLPVEKMGQGEDSLAEDLEYQSKSTKLNRAQKKEKKRLARLAKKEAKKQKKLAESVSNTDFKNLAKNSEHSADQEIKLKRRKNKNDEFQFEVDENGELNIDTKDVEIIGEEASKIYEEKHEQQTYSVKKARGDYRPPKIKWWEIYKLADRSFARRKIKKEVSKAARVKPDFISKTKLLILAILFGWCGAHNFYAKNKKKGFVTLSFLLLSILGLMLNDVPFFKAIELWIIGFTGFVVLVIWISDVVNIIFDRFEYRIQKDKFISELNIETRAKLGEKYIDLELLHKPWYVRFKVWCQKKKRNYEEWRHDRRQRMIEKEKAKLAKQEEKEKIDSEIAEYEAKELEKINAEKQQKSKELEKETKEEVSSETENKVKIPKKSRQAKISVNTKKSANNKTKKK